MPSGRAGTADPDTRLHRGISPPLLFVFVLGSVLGAGVYALTGELAAEAGGIIWLPVLIALAKIGRASCRERVESSVVAGTGDENEPERGGEVSEPVESTDDDERDTRRYMYLL